MKHSKIEWCDFTWNPWRGCTKVSPGCAHCYADTMGRRFGVEWGPGALRRLSSEATWNAPLRWNKYLTCDCGTVRYPVECPEERIVECPKCGSGYRPSRVFALSMGDFLEDEPLRWNYGSDAGSPDQPFPVGGVPTAWLARMCNTIRLTPNLHWLLVTKRPKAFQSRLNDAAHRAEAGCNRELQCWIRAWMTGTPPANVCVLASVEDQPTADEHIPHLLRIPARWHGLSLEPLLGPVNILGTHYGLGGHAYENELHWLIIGGESGPKARPCNVDLIRNLVGQGKRAGCAVFVNQVGSKPIGRYNEALNGWPEHNNPLNPIVPWKYKDPKGGDPSEWPEDLRVREWPDGL